MKKQIHHFFAKTPLILRVVSLYVFLSGAAGLYMYTSAPVQATHGTDTPPAAVVVEAAPVELKEVNGRPRQIELPRIGLVREVIDGQYDPATRGWTLTDDKAQYAEMTPLANNKTGQTLIYGHNTAAVLEPVRLVEVGDELLVTTDTGHVFVYTYTSDRVVIPTDVSVLKENPETSRVVLMTCEGWLSDTRRLLYFDFKEVR